MEHTSDLFYDHASIDYPVIDCDAHVNEPPDTWVGRVPAKYKDRAPKVVHRDEGDFWSFNDGESVRPVGLTATAGLSFLDFAPVGGTYEAMRPGSFDTKARLADITVVPPGHDAEQRRLARPVRSDHPDLGSVEEAQADVLKDIAIGWVVPAHPVHGIDEFGHGEAEATAGGFDLGIGKTAFSIVKQGVGGGK